VVRATTRDRSEARPRIRLAASEAAAERATADAHAVSAPGGFLVSLPASTITLKSSSSAYLSAYIASPNVIAAGDYPLTVSIHEVFGV
jgi:hypothetical protein